MHTTSMQLKHTLQTSTSIAAEMPALSGSICFGRLDIRNYNPEQPNMEAST